MPELPDVAHFERYVDATALHKKIARVEVADADLLEGVSVKGLRHELEGRAFDRTRRHGKYLFVATDDGGPWLILHFGMTGEPKYFRDAADTPEHARVVFHFENGYRLAYDCQRKLGLVSLTDDPDRFVSQRGLGPDALDDVDLERFRRLLEGRRGAIKSALMTQKILAGVGNVYSDEILFQARVHPATHVDRLGDDRLRETHRALRHVLELAIERHADVDEFPESWLLPNRDDGCPRCGAQIRTLKVSGRTAHFCPRCQPEDES